MAHIFSQTDLYRIWDNSFSDFHRRIWDIRSGHRFLILLLDLSSMLKQYLLGLENEMQSVI